MTIEQLAAQKREIAGTVYSLIARPAFTGNRHRLAAG